MEIAKGVEIVDLALLVRKKIMVLADFHIGFEECLNKQGVLVPRFQFKDIIQRLEKIFEKAKPEIIVVNGDIKHEFGRISEQEWRETLKLLDFLAARCKRLVLTKGNHDKILGPIAEKRNVEIAPYFEDGDVLIAHGDAIPQILKTHNSKLKTVIIGHEHPAVSIYESGRAEKFKCFLVGSYKGKALVVQPSFNLVTEGTDIIKEGVLSPFLEQSLDNFDVYVVADKVYDFGKLKNLKPSA